MLKVKVYLGEVLLLESAARKVTCRPNEISIVTPVIGDFLSLIYTNLSEKNEEIIISIKYTVIVEVEEDKYTKQLKKEIQWSLQ